MAALKQPQDPNALLAGFNGDRVAGPMMDNPYAPVGATGGGENPPPLPGGAGGAAPPDKIPFYQPPTPGAGGQTPSTDPMGPVLFDAPYANKPGVANNPVPPAVTPPPLPTAPVVTPTAPSATRGAVDSSINGLLQGNLNADVTRRRVDSARDVLNKQRTSATDTLGAQLAERGQLDSGGEQSARMRLDRGLNDDFSNTVNDIYANEGDAADKRQVAAMNAGVGLEGVDTAAKTAASRLGLDTELGRADVGLRGRAADTADKRLGLDTTLGTRSADTADKRLGLDTTLGTGRLGLDTELGRADVGLRGRIVNQGDTKLSNDMELGKGDLDVRKRSVDVTDAANKAQNALGNKNADINQSLGNRGLDLTNQGQQLDWNKFLGQLGLDRDKFNGGMDQSDLDRIMGILGLKKGAVDTSSGGHI